MQRTDTFITDSDEFEKEINSFYFKESKKIIDLARTQKKGKIFYKFSDKNAPDALVTEKELDFYYFPYHNKKIVMEIINDTPASSDSLFLQFANFPDRIVTVKFEYFKNDIELYKSYQFINTKWIEIPTKENYKFRF